MQYEKFVNIGKDHLDKQKAQYEEDLNAYVKKREVDGTRIQSEWFPQIEADIFISHSHKDKELACALAGWINNTFGLTCFIDSNLWGYSAKLLREMNRKLSNERKNEEGFVYDYESCNLVSQHVNAMLSIALQKMIDKVEVVILLNTDNSISMCTDNEINKTYSPWIYSEIVCTQIVRKKPLVVYRNYTRKNYDELGNTLLESVKVAMQFTVSYTVSLGHLKKITERILELWKDSNDSSKYEYALDALYDIVCPNEVDATRKISNTLSRQELTVIRKYFAENNNEEDVAAGAVILQKIICKGIRCCQDCERYNNE